MNEYSMAEEIRFRLFKDFKRNLWRTLIYGERFWEVSGFVSLSQKNEFVFVKRILHFWVFYGHSIAQKFLFRLLEDFIKVYRKLQYGENFFGKFQELPHCPRKIVLYLWSKFSILKHCTSIQSLGSLELRFWQTSKQIYGNSNMKKNFFRSFKVCLASSKRWFCIRWGNLTFLSFVSIFSH